jgi:hypothetical protein
MWSIDPIQIKALLGKQVTLRGSPCERGRVKEGS